MTKLGNSLINPPIGQTIIRFNMVSLSKTSFLDLPREIRDKIYSYSLSSPEPLEVVPSDDPAHAKPLYCDTLETSAKKLRRSYVSPFNTKGFADVFGETRALHKLTLGLLRCPNRLVACEAAATFYKFNAFSFRNHDSWDSLYCFMRMIGEANRSQLRHLMVRICEPEEVILYDDGVCTSSGLPQSQREVLSCNGTTVSRYPPPPPSDKGYSRGSRLRPAVQACCRLLGKTKTPLKLVLALDGSHVSGIFIEGPRGDQPREIALVDTMDMFTRQYMSEPGDAAARVELLWTIGIPNANYEDEQCKADIRASGWEVVGVERKLDGSRVYPPYLEAILTMRRQRSTAAETQLSGKKHPNVWSIGTLTGLIWA